MSWSEKRNSGSGVHLGFGCWSWPEINKWMVLLNLRCLLDIPEACPEFIGDPRTRNAHLGTSVYRYYSSSETVWDCYFLVRICTKTIRREYKTAEFYEKCVPYKSTNGEIIYLMYVVPCRYLESWTWTDKIFSNINFFLLKNYVCIIINQILLF